MKRRHIYASVCALAVSTFIWSDSPTVIQASQISPPAIEARKDNMQAGKDKKNDKQREEMKAKWDSLTDAQREEIYQLKDKCFELEIQIIDKYQEFGVFDNETHTRIKEKITSRKTGLRSDKKMPFHGCKPEKNVKPR